MADTIGLYNPANGFFYMRDASGDVTDFRFGPSGATGWQALTGDWDNDGIDTAGLYNPANGIVYLINDAVPTDSTTVTSYRFGPSGAEGWQAIAGDWDGLNGDSVSLYNPATGMIYINNALAGGSVAGFRFGPSGADWQAIGGDWDNNGSDSVSLYDPSTGMIYINNTLASASVAGYRFGPSGATGWEAVAGDWDGANGDSVSLYNPATGNFYINNDLAGGSVDALRFGPSGATGWQPLSGTWAESAFTLTAAATPAQVNEGSSLVFTVTLSAAQATATTVTFQLQPGNGSAANQGTTTTNLNDFSGGAFNPVTVTIPAGELTATFSVTPAADTLTELPETFSVDATIAGMGTQSLTATVLDGAVTGGQTFTLTSGTDLIPGLIGSAGTTNTDGSDTIVGTLTTSGLSQTLTAGDNLNGGAGVDTLNITVSGADAGDLQANPALTQVEKVLVSNAVSNTKAPVEIDLSLADTSITTVGTITSSTAGVETEFSNVGNLVDVVMKGRGDLTVGFTTTPVEGTGDALNLALNGVGASGAAATFATDGIETLNLTSSAAANFLDLETASGWTELSKVTIAGDKALNLTLGSGADSVTTIDASGATAAVTVTDIGSGNTTVTGGSANDVFNFGTNFDATASTGTGQYDVINGGSGTDTLQVALSSGGADTLFGNVQSIETLNITSTGGGSLTLDTKAQAAGIVTITEATGTGNELDIAFGTGYTGSATVNLDAGDDTVVNNGTANLTVTALASNIGTGDTLTGGTGTGSTDTLILTAAGTGSGATFGSGFTNFDTITIAAGTTATNGVSLTMDAANVASGHTLKVDAAALTNSAAQLVFDGADGVAGSAYSVIGGAGNDGIIAGSGNDTVDGGAGNDTITAGAGNDSLLGGSGDDTFMLGTSLSSGDTLNGGDGNDTLVLGSGSLTSAMFTNVSNIENLQFSGDATLDANIPFTSFDLSAATGAGTLTLASGYTNATTVTLGSGDAVVNSANVALTVNVQEDVVEGTTLGVTGGTGTDTVNITIGTATGTSSAITLATGAKIDVVNVLDTTGTGAHDGLYLNASGYASNLKVDATALDAGTGTGLTNDEGLIFSAAGSTAKITVLGGGGRDSIAGGNGNDSLDGGAGNDFLISGSGFDNLAGGDGDDAFLFTAGTGTGLELVPGLFDGNDTVAGGAGNDALVINPGTGGVGDLAFLNASSIEYLILAADSGSGTGVVTLDTRAQAAGIATVMLAGDDDFNVNAAGFSTALTFDLGYNDGDVSLVGGAANDTFVVIDTDVLDEDDILTGGSGTDTIRLDNGATGSATGEAVSITLGSGISGIEQIVVNDLATGTGGEGDVTINFSGYSATGTLVIDGSSLDANGTGDGETLTVDGSGLAATQALSVTGGASDDELDGGLGNDVFAGGSGNDELDGGAGNDVIDGGAGDDELLGGQGGDTLTGGLGNDVFFYEAQNESFLTAQDTITDFATGDTLDISGGAFSAVAFAGNVSTISQAATVLANTSGQAQTLAVFVQDSKQLWIDWNQDGVLNGGNDLVINLPSVTALTSAAFDGNAIVGTTGDDLLTGTTGDDTIFAMGSTGSTGDTVTGGSGNDTLLLGGSTGNKALVTGVESVMGSTGDDTLVLNSTGSISFDGSSGTDSFTFGVGGATGTLSNVESATGSTGADALILSSSSGTGLTFSLGSGNDSLTASGNSNTGSFDGGAGTGDTLTLVGTGNQFSITGVETASGSTGADTLTLTGDSATGLTFNLGSGNDSLTASGNSNTGSFDGGAGTGDTLTLVGTGNQFSITGVETASGSAGTDTLILTGSGATGLTFNLDSGNDSLTASGNSNTGSFDGGAGTGDTLTLIGTGNQFSITGVEGVTGSSGIDTILLGGTGSDTLYLGGSGTGGIVFTTWASGDTINLGATGGADTLVFGTGFAATGDNSLVFSNFDAGSGGDVLNLDAIVDGTTLTGFGSGSGVELGAGGVSTGIGGDVVIAYGASFGTGDIGTSTGQLDFAANGSGHIVLLAASGAATGFDVYLADSNLDGTVGSWSSNDIKLIGTVTLTGSDTIDNLASQNILLA